MAQMGEYRWTFVMLMAGMFLWLSTHALDLDFFEYVLKAAAELEEFEADELFLVALLLGIGFLIDFFIRLGRVRKQKEIEAERLDALKLTMRTVQDIVGNFLNQLQLFTYEAENTKGLKPESIQRINSMIFSTADRLQSLEAMDRLIQKDLGELKVVDERAGVKEEGTPRAAAPESRKETPTTPEGKGG